VGAFVKKRWGAKHSIVIRGRKTCISLEDGFWNELRHIPQSRSMTPSELIWMIDAGRPVNSNLSSSIRVFVLQYYISRIETSSGHQKADNSAAADLAA
jgi:predicted DNA-binding ribbon-helix-helix protein